jgi:hypothetical protein
MDGCASQHSQVRRRVSSAVKHPAWEFSDFLPLFFGRVGTGLLVQTSVGKGSGSGGRRTKRSGGLGFAEMNHGRGQQTDAGVAVLMDASTLQWKQSIAPAQLAALLFSC